MSYTKIDKLITELYAEKQKILKQMNAEKREKLNIFYKGKIQGIGLAMTYINNIDKPNFGKIPPSKLRLNNGK